MQNQTSRENLKPNAGRDLGQIIKTAPEEGTREHVELRIQESEGMSLSQTIAHLNGITRGSYRVSIRASSEWNEITVRLLDSSSRIPVAHGYVDRGHTKDDKAAAAEEVRFLVHAYLCR